MGYMKHVFGDDMNAEERERLDHAELVHTIACFHTQLIGRALRMHHDRFYGSAAKCRWCEEPRAEARATMLEHLAAAFQRAPADPHRATKTSDKPAYWHLIATLQPEGGFRIIQATAPDSTGETESKE